MSQFCSFALLLDEGEEPEGDEIGTKRRRAGLALNFIHHGFWPQESCVLCCSEYIASLVLHFGVNPKRVRDGDGVEHGCMAYAQSIFEYSVLCREQLNDGTTPYPLSHSTCALNNHV